MWLEDVVIACGPFVNNLTFVEIIQKENDTQTIQQLIFHIFRKSQNWGYVDLI